jgi:hypothetical protein
MECPTNNTLVDPNLIPATPDKKPQKPAVVSPEHSATDSGYGTGADSTPGPDNRQFPGSARSVRSLSVALNGENGETLQSFDKEVLPTTIDRFKAVCSELEPALVNYMLKHYVKHAAMAIRMMVLGTSSANAEPCMVVFCHKKRESRVRRFFDKAFARDLCRPSSPDLPSFRVVIVPRDLRFLAQFYTHLETDEEHVSDTCSGAPVRTNGVIGTGPVGTLGGLLKVNYDSTEFELYGITAAHILRPQLDWDSDSGESVDDLGSSEMPSYMPKEQDPETEGYANDLSSSDDEQEQNVGECTLFVTTQSDQEGSSNGPMTSSNYSKFLGFAPPQFSGGARYSEALSTELDWVLVEICQRPKPNRMRSGRNADLVEPSQSNMESCINRSVTLNVSRETAMDGVLVGLPASIWLDHTDGFTRVMTLEMSPDSSKCRKFAP